jgi:hypothetical protein
MVIFFVIWGVYQFLNREEEKQLKPNSNHYFDDEFMQK